MPRAARPAAMADMNGCAIPAPAPCANTKQAEARGGARRRAETRVLSFTWMVMGFASDSNIVPLRSTLSVMAGLVPAIHVLNAVKSIASVCTAQYDPDCSGQRGIHV